MNTKNDFLRLAEADPLVLNVSALGSFLWDDFVRDSMPQIKYIEELYDLKQLSRFGKELFDYMYNGGEVTTLVSLDDVEQYFQAKQDEEEPDYPKGYKPENAFWLNLFSEICNSAAWNELIKYSVGDQFISGNNAMNILNDLSKLIQKQITDGELPDDLGKVQKELEIIRNEFTEARKRGDLKLAAEKRIKGKDLVKQTESLSKKAVEQLKPEIERSVDKVKEESKDLKEAFKQLAGCHAGVGTHLNDINEKKKLSKKFKQNKNLRQLIKKLGALRTAWRERKKAVAARSNYSDIVGAKFSNEVVKAFPTELALTGTEAGRALFALKYAQKTILTKDYEAKTKNLCKGPVVLYVDISGSMMGLTETWSKAISMVVAEDCLQQKREVQIHLFDTCIQKSITLQPGGKDNNELLDFILSWVTQGGTSFGAVLDHAMSKAVIREKADVLMITDGQSQVSEAYLKRIKEFKSTKGIQWTAFVIGVEDHWCYKFCDYVHDVDVNCEASNAKLFQESLR